MIAVSDDCYRCGACIDACPVPNTITNILPGKVRVNTFSCIDCQQCLPVCRFGYIFTAPDPVPEVPASVSPQVDPAEPEAPADQLVKVARRKKSKGR